MLLRHIALSTQWLEFSEFLSTAPRNDALSQRTPLCGNSAQYRILRRKIRQLMRLPMIRSYSDHAANERTFLAWARTGLRLLGFLSVASGTASGVFRRDASAFVSLRVCMMHAR